MMLLSAALGVAVLFGVGALLWNSWRLAIATAKHRSS
jgi:hypothetical protein